MEGELLHQLLGSQAMYKQQMQQQHLYEQQQDLLRNLLVDELIATIRSLKANLDKITAKQERQLYEQLQSQINKLRGMLNNTRTDTLGKTRQSLSSSPTPLSNY